MRRADARSAAIGSPDCISQLFQVRSYSGEPNAAKRRRNLFANNCWRQALADELEEHGPEMAFVFGSSFLAGDAEWLAWEAGGPYWSVCRPSGEFECAGPSANPGEPMKVDESTGNAGRGDIDDASLFDVSFRDCAAGDELSKPGSSGCVDFIVEVHFECA